MQLIEMRKLFNLALECSVYLAPTDPGLTYQELEEVGRQAGKLPGETADAIANLHQQYQAPRFHPDINATAFWSTFMIGELPDYRNIGAFDFLFQTMNDNFRQIGTHGSGLERAVLVERAIQQGIPRLDIEAAIQITIYTGQIAEKNGVLRYKAPHVYEPLPSKQHRPTSSPRKSELRENIHSIVKDVVARRIDGRPSAAEAFDAFADALQPLGYKRFRIWWVQTVGELRRTDSIQSPLSSLVLSAALIEGVLTFVVTHARKLNLGTMGSKTFEGDPRNWKIEDLVNSAARGGESAILDELARTRADTVIKTRQRIHAGRLISEFPGPGPVPDLRPEEAREAKETAQLVARKVLDWLAKYPPS